MFLMKMKIIIINKYNINLLMCLFYFIALYNNFYSRHTHISNYKYIIQLLLKYLQKCIKQFYLPYIK